MATVLTLPVSRGASSYRRITSATGHFSTDLT
jgi:hypothetical protein